MTGALGIEPCLLVELDEERRRREARFGALVIDRGIADDGFGEDGLECFVGLAERLAAAAPIRHALA